MAKRWCFSMDNAERLAELRRKRAASLHAGKAMGGYEKRVKAIDEEIARLEAQNG